ncbi:MAG TPA: E2/UBC family protein [Chitinophagaceae bacterium]|nr:E2/UBC family protein [Chitinophagaceae bacterium]
MRRQFNLPEEDSEYLNSSGYGWETIAESGNWIIVHDYPVPDGYNVPRVSVALKIETGYPTTQIDMAYFFPQLNRKDGKPIRALTTIGLDGKHWQRWSRHRTGENPWRVGVDDICTHLAFVTQWLEREFQIR